MPASSTQFVILVGMLGSGKTSLLEALLGGGGAASTAVIVNEVGAINIDGAVLSESARGITMATLSNGCVCCSLTDDLVTTIEDLVVARAQSGLPPFDRVVLECSGLSRPGQVMISLTQLSGFGFRVHIVATYDCSRPPLERDEFEDAAAQLAAAHTVVLTKIDLVSPQRRAQAQEAVTTLNPLARVVDEFAQSVRAREAFSDVEVRPLASAIPGPQSSTTRIFLHPRVRVFRARFSERPDWDQVLEWLEDIAGIAGERLLRMKAIVGGPNGDDRVLLQSVGTTFAAPRRLMTSTLDELAAIFIVRDCAMEELQEVHTGCSVSWTSLQR
jgi:G3E family GTPase